jgi:filamentous hemagglutinin family protein
MPYEVRSEGQGFFVKHTGIVTFDEIAEANDELIGHDDWDAHTYQIWCYLEAGAIIGENRDARVISKVDGASVRRVSKNAVKVAFLTTNAKSMEIINAYIDNANPSEINGRIFSNEREARLWIASPI